MARSRTASKAGRRPTSRGELAKLKRIARSASKAHPGPLIYPNLAAGIHERSPLKFANAYFKKRVRAAFASPLATDFDFLVQTPTRVTYTGRSGPELVAAIQDELFHYHQYLSTYLTHPRYGPENECGFSRGDTLEPVGLREVGPGIFEFRVRGIVVGRKDLLRRIAGPWRTKKVQAPRVPAPERAGDAQIFISMPTRPDAREVGGVEWYEFNPDHWLHAHPKIPLRTPIPVRLRPRRELDLASPRYDELYRRGSVRIAFLFGYDDEGHNTTKDAKAVWRALTTPPSQRFTREKTGPYGYHGRGLGFSDPTNGHFAQLNGTKVARTIGAEVRLYNFDKSSRLSAAALTEQFVSAFRDNDVVLYDGHANYGGGFYIGERGVDILWAVDVGSYKPLFSSAYQIFAIGACHAAGYFADLFYNELHPRKTPRNFDVIAAVNETAFLDANHQMLALVRALLQIGVPEKDEPLGYDGILLRQSRPASFQAYIGVFGEPERLARTAARAR